MSNGYGRIEDSQEQPLDLRLGLEVLRRRRLSIGLATLAVLIPVLVAVLTRPAVYEATAKVAIQHTPLVMQLGLDYMPSQPAEREWGDAITAVVSSDAVLGRVVDGSRFRADSALEERGGFLGWLRGSEMEPPLAPQQERQMIIEGLRRSLTFELTGGATVLKVSALSRDPVTATALANGVADAYVGYRQNERQEALRRATAWLNQNTLELRGQIERQEQAIAELVVRTGIVPSAAEEQADESKAKLMEELQLARIELMTIRQRLAEIGPGRSERGVAGAGRDDLALLEEEYSKARAALEMARLRYTPTHPELARLEAVVAGLQARLASETGDLARASAGAESIREYRALQAEKPRLEARVAVLQRALDDLSERAGPDAEALSAYERRERELAVDRQMLEVVLQRRNETMLASATEHPEARILDPAIVPIAPVGPKRGKWVLLGAGLAISFGFGFGLLREMLDQGVRDAGDVADLLGVPFLGVIPRIHEGAAPELETRAYYGSPASEGFRNLRTALLFATQSSVGKPKLGRLVVTSGVAGEGKTTVAVNVAESFAQVGWRVLLVDGDLRRSRVHEALGLERAPGLAELLREEATLDEVIRTSEALGFQVIPAGNTPENPSELLSSERLDRAVSEIKERYDLIVIDSPVILSVPDALLLSARAEATLLVHKPGGLEKTAFVRIRADLERAGAHVLGFVFTQVPTADPYLYPSYLKSPYVEPRRRFWRRLLPERFRPTRSG